MHVLIRQAIGRLAGSTFGGTSASLIGVEIPEIASNIAGRQFIEGENYRAKP